MKRIFLAVAVAFIVSVISILAFALTPGYLSYQQLRSSTHLKPKQIEKVMIELLAATRAKDKIETGENFSELDLRVILDAKVEDRHAMVLRMGHLDIMSIDPSGTELKHHLFKAVSRDVAIMAQDNSSLGLTMRKYAYRCAIREPQFMCHGSLQNAPPVITSKCTTSDGCFLLG